MQAEHKKKVNAAKQLTVAYQGRRTGLELDNNGKSTVMTDWSQQILSSMQPICDVLDQNTTDKPYTSALQQQFALITNADLTPSARILTEMKTHQQSFANFSLNISKAYQRRAQQKKLSAMKRQHFEQLAKNSHDKQKQLEQADKVSFDQFLSQYFAQNQDG